MTQSDIPSQVTVDITDFAHGGEGIGRVNSQVVFVDGAVVGDRHVVVELDSERSSTSLWRGVATAVGQESTLRADQAVSCLAAEEGAGCCDFLNVAPEKAAAAKAGIVVDQMRRIGHIDVTPTYEALSPFRGWRTRMRLAVDESGRAGLRARRSHHIVTGTTCSQAVPGLMDGIETMCFTPGAEVILAMDSDGVRHIVEVGGTLTSHPHDGRGVRQFSHSPRGRRGHAYIIEGGDHCVERVPGVARSKLTGGKTMTVSADDRTFLLPATGFWQPHRAAAGRYRELVHELLPEVHGGVAWDLYGGVGLFADILAGKTRGPVDSVEVDKSARTWGRRSLQTLSERPFRLPSIRFVTSRVDRSWSVLRRNNQGGVDLVVLDPPRKGAGKKVIQQIAAANPRSVVHIACDPATGARDYAEWLSHGYEISSIRVIDAFPGTHHMEIIAALSKTS